MESSLYKNIFVLILASSAGKGQEVETEELGNEGRGRRMSNPWQSFNQRGADPRTQKGQLT